MTPSPDSLSAALKSARGVTGWTQEQMADHAGVSRYTLQKAEYGQPVGARSERLLREAVAKITGVEEPADPLKKLTAQVAALQHTVNEIARGAA